MSGWACLSQLVPSSNLLLHFFSKQYCATSCRCVLREPSVGRPRKRRLPLTIVQAIEMTNLSSHHDQGESEEEVWQTPHRLMRKLHELLRATLWQPLEKQGQVTSFKSLSDLSNRALNIL
jgi:hypothetical protein